MLPVAVPGPPAGEHRSGGAGARGTGERRRSSRARCRCWHTGRVPAGDHTCDAGESLPGGTVTPAVRIGATVRRVTGPWSTCVHALLRHLADAGFGGAPRFLGIDRHGREVLSFIEGEVTAGHVPAGLYHDAALTGARPPAAAVPRRDRRTRPCTPRGLAVPGRRAGDRPVICHNEVGPYNTVYRGGRPVAFIDWDCAAPAPPERDIAYAMWRFVPL